MSEQRVHGLKQAGRRCACLAAISVATWALLAWVAAEALLAQAELTKADVLVVLAGSSTYQERAARAAQLFHEGRAPKIVLTNDNQQGGWSQIEQRNTFFVERAAQELRRRGVPAQSIEVITAPVSSTYEEAVRLRDYAGEHQLKSILAVSSAYQSRRALWTLRRVFRGSNVAIGLDAPPPGHQTPGPAVWWLYKLGWKMVPGEYLKFGLYLLRY